VDFAPTAEMERIRHEIRAVLESVLPQGWQGCGFLPMDVPPDALPVAQALDRALAAKQLLAPAWPVEYGGRGLTPFEQFALYEELGYALAPRLTTISVDLVGPVLILYGSAEQRRRHLPAIAEDATVWCQGFSEPNAGSDLTSLRTRAERRGDVYVVNGHKIWTSMAHRASWMILLARTGDQDARARTLSLFLVPTDAPGLQIRPIHDAVHEHALNEAFLDNVEVPAENLIGEENAGWRYATTLLQYERGDALFIGQFRRMLDDLETRLRCEPGPLPNARGLIAQHEIDWQMARLLTLRVVSMQAKGLLPDLEASQAKLFVSEAYQRLGATAQRLCGLYGALARREPLAPLGGRIEPAAIASTTATLIAGTSEIQRSIIATRGLGLPRS
jgi:alkylation response protein AidB-like acyl-CoA dehydrogenase